MKKYLYLLVVAMFSTMTFTLTSCGEGNSEKSANGNFESAQIELADMFKQKGWYSFAGGGRNRMLINSDNYVTINQTPIGLVFGVTEWLDATGYKQIAYLSLADASKTDNPQAPSFDKTMTRVSLDLDGESMLLITERPVDNMVNLADDAEAVVLVQRMMKAKKARFYITTMDGQNLTYTFSPYNQNYTSVEE